MTEYEENIALFGTPHRDPEPRLIRCGELSLELDRGALRHIRFAGREIIRQIAFVVRDKDWGTYDAEPQDLTIEEDAEAFSITFQVRCGDAGQSLRAQIAISGSATGRLACNAVAETDDAFLTNRTGFCVLHPILGVAGAPVRVEHCDGSVEEAAFPVLIEPWQPFRDIRELGHRLEDGTRVLCRLEGDVFEMEDQRNWTDASFKTYSRPLALPWPYRIEPGEVVRQAVTVGVQPVAEPSRRAPIAHPAAQPQASRRIALTLKPAEGTHPAMGIVVAPEECAATRAHKSDLEALGPQAVLFHYDPTAGHNRADLADFAALAGEIDAECTLECIVPGLADPDEELRAIAEDAQSAGLSPDGLFVCPSVDRQSTPPGSEWPACPPLRQIYEAARRAFPGARIGGGMASYFTELNRKRPPVEKLDFVSHATTPIVHAADDASVMETLEAMPAVLVSARAIIGRDKPYRLGPVTIGMRQNPYGSRTMPNPDNKRIPMAAVDPRHRGLFGAAFAVGVAARCTEEALETLTLGALTGPFGLIADADGSTARHPLFFAVAALAEFAGKRKRVVESAQPTHLLAVAAEREDGRQSLLCANLTGRTLSAELPAVFLGSEARRLDADLLCRNGYALPANLPPFATDRSFTLPPYAVVLLHSDPILHTGAGH